MYVAHEYRFFSALVFTMFLQHRKGLKKKGEDDIFLSFNYYVAHCFRVQPPLIHIFTVVTPSLDVKHAKALKQAAEQQARVRAVDLICVQYKEIMEWSGSISAFFCEDVHI